MRKNFLLLLVAVMAIINVINANTVSVGNAQNIAVNFFKLNARNLSPRIAVSAVLKYTKTEADGTVDFYVFDINPVKGFVIVSADDNSKPVIGYSTESDFRLGFENTGMQNWVKRVSGKIYNAIQLHLTATSDISNQWSSYTQGIQPSALTLKSNPVNPLLTTNWDQSPYYNALCPYNTTDQERTVTGCVATAMAQIMKYWNYPAQGKGSNSYVPNNSVYGTQAANFDTTTYRWRQMPNSLSTSGNLSIATLMYQCGVSVDMNYGDMVQGGSGAFVRTAETFWGGPSAQSAFVDNFFYDPNTIQGVAETDYSNSGWIALIEAELNAGRVVQYEGDDQSAGGHTWVCDGYEAGDLMHMNWGWGGSSNGYFDVSNLNAGGYNFNQNDAALIGIQPLPHINVRADASPGSLCLGSSTAVTAYGPASATYSWSPATGLSCATCATTSAQPAATTIYTVTVDSANITNIYNLVITVNPTLNANVAAAGTSCYGYTDGTETATPVGGTANYTYHWSNGKTTSSLSHLAPGNYNVTITDAKGCTATGGGSVTQPAVINVSLTPSNSHCGPADAILSAVVTGGTPAYFYQWSNGAGGPDASGLATGTYTVTIYDNQGCSGTSTTSITSTGSPVHINFNTSFTNPTNGLSNGTASVSNISGGTPPYTTVMWSNGETSATATNLAAGTYTVTVMDQNGCQQSATVTLNGPTGINAVTQDISFSVYPNPAATALTVQLDKVENGTTLSVKNVLGQTLVYQALTDLQNQIDVSHFSDGVYFVELRQAEKMSVKQIVVRR